MFGRAGHFRRVCAPLPHRAEAVLTVDGAERHRQITPGHGSSIRRVRVCHDAQGGPIPLFHQQRFCPQGIQQFPGPDTKEERQGGRAGTPPQLQRVDRMFQGRFQLL